MNSSVESLSYSSFALKHTTRNNSLSEALLQENLSITDISNQGPKIINIEDNGLVDDAAARPIKCDWQQCEYEYNNQKKLMMQIGKYIGKPSIKDMKECDKCDFKTKTVAALDVHMGNHHNKSSNQSGEVR